MNLWKTTRHLTIIIFTSVWSLKSYALACETKDKVKNATYPITTTTAIPNGLPKNTVLWRQPTTTVTVECYMDNYTELAEHVYFYINPKK